MGTMMNGYHFDLAKDGSNQYEVVINGQSVIMGANYISALDVYKAITTDYLERCIFTNTVEMIKQYNSDGTFAGELVRSNKKMNHDMKEKWTRPLPEGMRFLSANHTNDYFVIGKPEQVVTRFGQYTVGQTGAVLKTAKGYFIKKNNGQNIFSKDLADVVSTLPEDGLIRAYANGLGIETAKVIRVLIQPILTDTECVYQVTEEIEEIKYLKIKKENK